MMNATLSRFSNSSAATTVLTSLFTGLIVGAASLVMSIAFESERQLGTLVSYRNLAFMAENVVTSSVDDIEKGTYKEEKIFDFETAELAMNAIDFKNIVPEPLSREFVDLWHMTRRTKALIPKRSTELTDLRALKERAEKDLKRIDKCIYSSGIVDKNGEELAFFRSGTSLARFFWHMPFRRFCDLDP